MLHNVHKQSGLKWLPDGRATGQGNLPSALLTDNRGLNIEMLDRQQNPKA